MENGFSLEQAKSVLDNGISQAQEMLGNPSMIDELLSQLSEKMKEVSTIGNSLANIPLMASMVKCYITREYTEVSPKVVALLVSAFIYVVKKKDLIKDSVPLAGMMDDLAVVALALRLSEPELKAFSEWREQNRPVQS